MFIENFNALKKYLMESLNGICDADPKAVTRYIIALLKKPRSEGDLKMFFLDELEVFLTKDTKNFVEKLFEAINSKSYLPITEVKIKTEEGFIDDAKSSDDSKSFQKEKTFDAFSSHSKGSQSSFSETSSLGGTYWNRKDDLLPVKENIKREVTQEFHQNENFSFKKKSSNLVSVPTNVTKFSVFTSRCKNYDEKGYCLLGDSCTFYHGSDPVVVENISALNIEARYIPEPYNPEHPIIEQQRGDINSNCSNHMIPLHEFSQAPPVIPAQQLHQPAFQYAQNSRPFQSHQPTAIQIKREGDNLSYDASKKRKNLSCPEQSELKHKRVISDFTANTSELENVPTKLSCDTDRHSSNLKKSVEKSTVNVKNLTNLQEDIPVHSKANISSSSCHERNSKEDKKMLSTTLADALKDVSSVKPSLSLRDLCHKKLELTKKVIQHQKLIVQKLRKTKDAKERDILKNISDDLSSKIKILQMELKNFLQQKKTSENEKAKSVEREKRILDTEMDLYRILHKGHDTDITALLNKVTVLKEKAKAFGLLNSPSEKARLKTKSSMPFTSRFKSKQFYPPKLLKTDNRPKALLVSGIEEANKDFFLNFVLKFPGIEKIESVAEGCIISLNSRKAAEKMLKKIIAFGDENISIAWYQMDQHLESDLTVSSKKEEDFIFYHYEEDMDDEQDDDQRGIRPWRC